MEITEQCPKCNKIVPHKITVIAAPGTYFLTCSKCKYKYPVKVVSVFDKFGKMSAKIIK